MKKPTVIINAAISIDGKLALGSFKQTRFSSEEDMARVHNLRNSVDAILVGINTVLYDDPALTVKEKYVKNPKNPIRIVMDSNLKIPDNAKVLNEEARTIIVTTEHAELKDKKLEILRCGKGRVNLELMLDHLYQIGVRRLLVEGGGTVIYSFLKSRLADELNLYIAPTIIGSGGPDLASGPAAMKYEELQFYELVEMRKLGPGIYCRYKIKE